MTDRNNAGDQESLADAIAKTVIDHPAVVSMASGRLGALATHLPHRKLVGVRIPEAGGPVEIGVIIRFGQHIPNVTESLRELVRTVAGNVSVDIVIVDVDETPDSRS